LLDHQSLERICVFRHSSAKRWDYALFTAPISAGGPYHLGHAFELILFSPNNTHEVINQSSDFTTQRSTSIRELWFRLIAVIDFAQVVRSAEWSFAAA